jgi:protein involved in polysaccharide export with SLBB domain
METNVRNPNYKRYVPVLAFLLVVMACGGGNYRPAVTAEQMTSEPMTSQVLSVGDVVDIKFLYTPELNDTQRIRPDGNVDLQIIGQVKAEGKSVAALQQELNQRYASELKRPGVTVTAKDLRNSKVYVGGEVTKPGQVDVPGTLTALEAIGQAGGFNSTTANVGNVVVIRNRDGKQYGTVVNLKDALNGQETQPFYLRPGDTVFVPKTTIAKANQWVEQHISNMLPKMPVSLAP